MKKLIAVSIGAIALAGCNATVYTPRPVVYADPYPAVARPYPVVTRPPVVITPRPYRPYAVRPNCYSVWDRTPMGYRERRVCR